MVSSAVLGPYYFAGALCSLVASLFVIVSYARFKELRRHPSSLVLWRAALDVLFSLSFVLLYLWEGAQDECSALGFVFQVAVLGSQSYYFMLAVDLLAALRNPFRLPKANLPRYHAFVWGTSLASAVVLLATGSFEYRSGMQVCWIKNNGSGRVNVLNWALFFGPVLVYFVGSAAIVMYATMRLKAGLEASFKVRQRVLRNGQRYVMAYVAYWSAAIGVYAAVYSVEREDADQGREEDPEEHLALYATLALLIAIRGVVDVSVWSYNENALGAYRRWWRSRGRARVADGAAAPAAATPAKSPAVAAGSSQAGAGSAAAAAAADDDDDGSGEGINRALRLEVLALTTRAICKSVAADRPLPARLSEGNFPRTLSADSDDPNVRTVVLREGGHRVPFHDFGGDAFAFLRARFGIAPDEYVASVRGGGSGAAVMERYTEGASGSFFYFTEDRRYLVKTLSRGEAESMLALLPGYARHMTENPNSLITRFCGFHAVEMYAVTKYFVVMQSVFLGELPVDRRYDLKGSWVSRHARPRVKAARRGRARRLAEQAGGGVLKDGDLNFQVSLGDETRRLFLAESEKDARFLCAEGVLDYSLLLGVHYARQKTVPIEPPEDDGGARCRRSAFQRLHGGVQAAYVEGPLVYSFGIIDVLQRWTLKKRAERAAKVYLKCVDGDGLSAIDPERYCERFVGAMSAITEPPERENLVSRRLSFLAAVDTGARGGGAVVVDVNLSAEEPAAGATE